MGTMLHNIAYTFFSTTFDKLPSTAVATGVENRRSTAELENPHVHLLYGGLGKSLASVLWTCTAKSIRTLLVTIAVHTHTGSVSSIAVCHAQAARSPGGSQTSHRYWAGRGHAFRPTVKCPHLPARTCRIAPSLLSSATQYWHWWQLAPTRPACSFLSSGKASSPVWLALHSQQHAVRRAWFFLQWSPGSGVRWLTAQNLGIFLSLLYLWTFVLGLGADRSYIWWQI